MGECGRGEAMLYFTHHSRGSHDSESLTFVTEEEMLVPCHCLKENKPLGPLYFFPLSH